jgi:Ca2+-binding EF-hand superfamily protein
MSFNLYDHNSDGKISLQEMKRYLASVFQVVYETQPETRSRIGVGPEELADVTAEQAFGDSVLVGGELTFEQFKVWYASGQREPEEVDNSAQDLEKMLSLANLRLSDN